MSETKTNTLQESDNSLLGTEKIGKLMWKFSVPAIISGLVSAAYNIVDQIFIGQGVGELGMAATNVAFPLVTISTALALLFGVGGASNFSLSMGRGEPEKASKIAGNALTWMVLSGVVVGIIAIVFMRPLLFVFGATESIMPYAEPYTLITNIGIPFLVFSTGAANLIRADGSPTFSMMVMLSGAVFNLVFDPIFLFVFHMGIEGIALATVLGQVLSSIVALFYFLRKFKTVQLKKEHFRLQPQTTKLICSLGAAACFNQLAMTVVQIVKSNILRHYGALSVYGSEIPLAAVGAVSKVLVVSMAFILGIAQGCQPIISYNYGAKHYDRVKETYKRAILSATLFSVVSFLCFQLFPRQILSIFGSGSEMFYEFAIKYMRIFLLLTFINGIQPVTANFFTSIGKANLGFWISLTRQILLLVPLLLILPIFFGMEGVMWAGPLSDGVAALLAIVFAVREIKKMNGLESQSNTIKATPVGDIS
ncbi:MATE family efflux transporter [Eubacteriales bacterium OttesenSCG-928-A19]|nr:MATE family efflux transporter [Eubacteriales bacterium OttesenSCG-928-A19]